MRLSQPGFAATGGGAVAELRVSGVIVADDAEGVIPRFPEEASVEPQSIDFLPPGPGDVPRLILPSFLALFQPGINAPAMDLEIDAFLL